MKQIWDVEELSKYWSLGFEELELLKSKPERNHLGLAVQLKYYQYTGQFPQSPSEIPETILYYLSGQLDKSSFGLEQYDWAGRSGKRHRREILTFLGIRRVSTLDKKQLSSWLVANVYPKGKDIEEAKALAFKLASKIAG